MPALANQEDWEHLKNNKGCCEKAQKPYGKPFPRNGQASASRTPFLSVKKKIVFFLPRFFYSITRFKKIFRFFGKGLPKEKIPVAQGDSSVSDSPTRSVSFPTSWEAVGR